MPLPREAEGRPGRPETREQAESRADTRAPSPPAEGRPRRAVTAPRSPCRAAGSRCRPSSSRRGRRGLLPARCCRYARRNEGATPPRSAPRSRLAQGRKRFRQPLARAQLERQERARVLLDEPQLSTTPRGRSRLPARRAAARSRRSSPASEHRGDQAVGPGRWPVRLAQILEQQDRRLRAVVAEEPRQERALDLGVDDVLGGEPLRCALVDRHLRECSRTIHEGDEESPGRRVAPAGHLLDRRTGVPASSAIRCSITSALRVAESGARRRCPRRSRARRPPAASSAPPRAARAQ